MARWHAYIDATYSTPHVTTSASAAAPKSNAVYYKATGHNLAEQFRAFWQHYGGLKVFGVPLTEPFTENGEQWQYFERFALVLDAGTVESVRLGGQLTQGRAFATVSASGSTPTTKYFPATGHTVAGEFLAFWVTHHGALLLGNPLLQVISEGNGDGTGRRYAVQWFEGDRLEFHPELTGTGYSVELGLLGKQALIAQGWLS